MGKNSKTYSHTLAKVFGRHFQTFQTFFPTSSNLIELLTKQQQLNCSIAVTL